MLRAFIAVKVPATPELLGLHARLVGLAGAPRPVAFHSLHVTLKFLGDIRAEQIAEIAATVEPIARRVPSETVTLRGLGAFPNPRRPAVVWVGLEEADALAALAADLEQRLEPLGFLPERRAFQPHITVLRVPSRPPAALPGLLDELAQAPFGSVQINSMELFQSELAPGGSRYTELRRFPLG